MDNDEQRDETAPMIEDDPVKPGAESEAVDAVVEAEAPQAADPHMPEPQALPEAPGGGVDHSGDEQDADSPDPAPILAPQELRAILEALIFTSPQPLTPRDIGQVLAEVPRESWEAAIAQLKEDYSRDDRGLQLVEVAGGYQITTRPEYNDWVRELLDPRAPNKLSIQALETLAVIAYKQPVTMPEVIELRGVKSGGVIKTLLERRLIKITGRKEVVGRPMLYGTTKDFLLTFGLKNLSELPKIEEFADVLGE
jgi:segregation and condensation protein B